MCQLWEEAVSQLLESSKNIILIAVVVEGGDKYEVDLGEFVIIYRFTR